MLSRRAKRAKQKSKPLAVVVKHGDGCTSTCEGHLLITVDPDMEKTIANGNEVKNCKHTMNKKDAKKIKEEKKKREKEVIKKGGQISHSLFENGNHVVC